MRLTLVGLPLGNIEDISFRAIKTISEAKLVICEDTRVFHKLWQKLMNLGYAKEAFGGKLMVINDFNEAKRIGYLIDEIKLYGEAVLVSDAGMPLISDPGYKLVREAVSAGIEVTSVSGPTAAITATAISGLPTDHIYMIGFLPKKHSKRVRLFEAIKSLDSTTVVLYEAPQRVVKTLKEMAEYIEGDCELVVARELTKQHEEVVRTTLLAAIKDFEGKGILGEVVLLLRTC